MPLNSEIMRLVRHIDETGQGSITAVRDLWPVNLTPNEQEELLQEAMAARVSEALRRVLIRGRIERAEQQEAREMRVEVEVVAQKTEVITINVEVLEKMTVDVRGERRKVVDITLEDSEFLVARAEGMFQGAARHLQFHKYIHDRLEETGAHTVGDLGVREQRRIAGMVEALEKRVELVPGPGPKRKALAAKT